MFLVFHKPQTSRKELFTRKPKNWNESITDMSQICHRYASRLRSSSFLTRNEKRCERNKRAVSNLFTEAAGVGRRLVFGEQNETREEGKVGNKRKR